MKAIVLTSQRSGSTFLTHCLNSHPQVRCYGEILVNGLYRREDVPALLNRFRLTSRAWRYAVSGAWRPARFLDRFYAREEAPVMAFKVMYNHLADPRIRRYLGAHAEIRIIHLRRDNLLKQYTSKVLAPLKFGNRRWGATNPQPVLATRIEPNQAIEAMRHMQARFEEHERLFAAHRRIELVYEEMVDGAGLSAGAARAVTQLLEVEPAPMASRTVKVNPDRLEAIIENYDELSRALRGTEFERFLDQEGSRHDHRP